MNDTDITKGIVLQFSGTGVGDQVALTLEARSMETGGSIKRVREASNGSGLFDEGSIKRVRSL